jgi:protocatechuate 3,4-dioxygenase beta subunit
MDNDDATVGTILSRRDALTLAARAGSFLAFGGVLMRDADAVYQARAQQEVRLVASPALTEGPFFVDEKLNRSDLIGETTRAAVKNGAPLALTVRLYKLTDGKFAPLAGAMVDIWHCDAEGVYSDEDNPMNHENTAGQKWLRGYQVSDANGLVKFSTIVPGWYGGRTTHIHFKVRQTLDGKTKEFTSQLFFHDAVVDGIYVNAPYVLRGTREARNATDGIYSERQVDGTSAGEQLLLDLHKADKGYRAEYSVVLTDDSLKAGRRRGFGGPPDWR